MALEQFSDDPDFESRSNLERCVLRIASVCLFVLLCPRSQGQAECGVGRSRRQPHHHHRHPGVTTHNSPWGHGDRWRKSSDDIMSRGRVGDGGGVKGEGTNVMMAEW
jgi:hypothetical protein